MCVCAAASENSTCVQAAVGRITDMSLIMIVQRRASHCVPVSQCCRGEGGVQEIKAGSVCRGDEQRRQGGSRRKRRPDLDLLD